MAEMTARERELRQRLRDDFPFYASRCLWINDKDGVRRRLQLNKAQLYIHGRLQDQLATTGKVRAIILKGRQQGASTYVGARFYWRSTSRPGRRVFILTHEDQATQNLFNMVKRYHDNTPDLVKPSTGKANEKELAFDRLDSGYKVATAGTKGAGRSLTAQLFHGSEVGFWPHAATHAAGVMQAISKGDGTEIILESTANGVGGWFHQQWQEAERGAGEFTAIFVPWFWQSEYVAPVPADFTLDQAPDEQGESEASYAAAWDLTPEQMAWRRLKVKELGLTLFRQEYPACAAEAFQMSGHDSFIPSNIVVRARKFTAEPSGPLILGFDPAWTGGDRHGLARRRGRKLLSVEGKPGLTITESTGWLRSVIDAEKPAKAFIDVSGGYGAGVYDRLCELNYGGIVVPVSFGSRPTDPPKFDNQGMKLPGPLNRRAEIWWRSRDWLEGEAGADIPDQDALQADACGPGYRYDTETRLVLEEKATMKKRGVVSPDLWDAVALTFAEPVFETEPTRETWRPPGGGRRRGWMGT